MKLGNIAARVLPEKYFRTLARYYMRLRLFGTTYHCTFCIGGFSRFYPAGFPFAVLKEQDVVGAGTRENVRCPNCNSSNRERLVYLYLCNVAGITQKKLSMLHVAPEPTLQRRLKQLPNLSHVSVDIGSPHADQVMDLRSLKFPDASFDIVICNHVLEHIPEDAMAMKEVLRVLRPGGFAILQVPISMKLEHTFEDFSIIDPNERERVFGQHDHVRMYARDYKDRLAAAGFSVEVLDYPQVLGERTVRWYALDERERLYIAKNQSK